MFILQSPPGAPARTGQSARPGFRFPLHRETRRQAGQKHADCPDTRHPPDVPDQRKAGDDCKECGDEAGRAVLRHFDRLEFALASASGLLRALALLLSPESVDVRDLGRTAKFQAGGGEAVAHSSVRPFHGSAVTLQLLAIADRHHKLDDLADDAGQDDDGADRRDYQPRLPATNRRNAACAGSCPSGPARRAA